MSKPKTIARFIFRLLIIPILPLIAAGYWTASKDLTYIQSVKEIWKDF